MPSDRRQHALDEQYDRLRGRRGRLEECRSDAGEGNTQQDEYGIFLYPYQRQLLEEIQRNLEKSFVISMPRRIGKKAYREAVKGLLAE